MNYFMIFNILIRNSEREVITITYFDDLLTSSRRTCIVYHNQSIKLTTLPNLFLPSAMTKVTNRRIQSVVLFMIQEEYYN